MKNFPAAHLPTEPDIRRDRLKGMGFWAGLLSVGDGGQVGLTSVRPMEEDDRIRSDQGQTGCGGGF